MQLADLLEQKKISVYQCSKKSGIPYTTLSELIKGKSRIEKCSAATVYKLAKALQLSMEELLEKVGDTLHRIPFAAFRSNLCRRIKEEGDLRFIIEALQQDEVGRYWKLKWYPEAFYTLAMVDYLSRLHDIPLCTNYMDIRNSSLKEPIFPCDFDHQRQASEEEAIPEFMRFNIVERNIRNIH